MQMGARWVHELTLYSVSVTYTTFHFPQTPERRTFPHLSAQH